MTISTKMYHKLENIIRSKGSTCYAAKYTTIYDCEDSCLLYTTCYSSRYPENKPSAADKYAAALELLTPEKLMEMLL